MNMEKMGNGTTGQGTRAEQYFSGVASSKDFLAAKKFKEKYIDTGKLELSLSDTPTDTEVLKEYIQGLGVRFMPNISPDGIIEELRKAGIIIPPPPVEKVKIEKPIEAIKTEYINLEKPKSAEVDEQTLKLLEANLLFEEVHKAKIFKNGEELNVVYEKSLTLEKERPIETPEYYYGFASLVKGGEEEIKNELESLDKRKKDFQDNEPSDLALKNKLDQAKKIATITERGLAYGVSELGWYGDNISIEPASEFDDVKRGVDDVLEIKKDGDESSFMGLGIDVTFRGLYSEQFQNKFFNLLKSIRNGHQTKVKFFKNHKGEMMKEFAVPKMVLFFSVNDVKDIVEMVKSADNSDNKNDFNNSPQKFNVMNQIINSCKHLAAFAEESHNNVFRKYVAVENSIKELSWQNPEIKQMLDIKQHDQTSRHLRELITQFKNEEQKGTLK